MFRRIRCVGGGPWNYIVPLWECVLVFSLGDHQGRERIGCGFEIYKFMKQTL